tara:strand:- start:2716 stop:4218 length:1503 start_codon:yes stop_codon:yes gene_type:complete
MKFEGNNARKLPGKKEISFSLDHVFISSLTGEAYFGFSGESKTLQFTFKKGKIFDPSGNYVFSYGTDAEFSVSGQLSENFYDYSINNTSIARGVSKDSFKIENFFINTNNCNLDADLSISSDAIPHSFTTPSSLTLGQPLTCQMTNSSTDATIHVFAVELKDSTASNYAVASFPSAIAPQATENFVLNNVGGLQGNHDIHLKIHTSIGILSIEDKTDASEVEQITVWNELEPMDSEISALLNSAPLNSSITDTYQYTSSIVGSNLGQQVSPTLEYVEGNIGKYYKVTGVTVYDKGDGYSGDATVTFSTGQGNDVQAQGTVVMGQGDDQGKVDSVTITNSGVYFDQPPVAVFSGDLDPNVNFAHQAQAVVTTEQYEKTFSNSWDIYVGTVLSGSVISYKTNSYTGNQGENSYPYGVYGPGIYEHTTKYALAANQSFFVKVKFNSFDDYDPMKVKLKLTGTMADSRTNNSAEEVEITGKNTNIITTTSTTSSAFDDIVIGGE